MSVDRQRTLGPDQAISRHEPGKSLLGPVFGARRSLREHHVSELGGGVVYPHFDVVAEIDADGWYGDPTWPTEDLVAGFAATVGDEVAKRVTEILALRDNS